MAITVHLPHSGLQAQDSVLRIDMPEGQRMELVWVEGGTFTMGSNDARGVDKRYESTRPEHTVTVRGCYMGRYEVTQAQWRAVMGENPSHFSGNDSLPVEMVTWTDAQRFAAMLSQMTGHRFRLPTEAEWEYAARGGNRADGQPYAGCDRNHLPEYAWFCVNSEGHTHPVGRLKSNAMGLHDMSGNVAEWCSDWAGTYPADRTISPQGPDEGTQRVVRGGYAGGNKWACFASSRGHQDPDTPSAFIGLRLAMDD